MKTDWVKISDKIPEPYEDILFIDADGIQIGFHVKERIKGKLVWHINGEENSYYSFGEVTHWMPLPEYPTKK